MEMSKRKNNLKVVAISLDYTLAKNVSDLGDVKKRHIDYGKYVQKIFSITHSPRKMGLRQKVLSERVEVFPTSSISPCFFVFDALKRAGWIFKRHRIDLVLTQDPFVTALVGYLLKLKYRCAYLIHFHGDFWENPYWLREKWYNFLLLELSKFLVRKADGIRVVSSGIKEKLVKAGISPKKIRVIPTPVNVEKFRDFNIGQIQRIRKENQHRKTVINVGREDKSKDFNTLFKAIELVYEKCRNLALVQIGAGFYLSEKIKADENLLLVSKPRTPYEELINYYYAADVYVSSSCHESLGKVLIEAMTCGLPVVATATTGSKDIVVDGETGFLVPIGDSEALARKIIYLLDNSERAKAMGKQGREVVKKKFVRQKLIKKTVGFWEDLVRLHRKAGKKSLLIITRRLDKDDGQTGFFYVWTKKFAEQTDRLKVLCLEKGNTEGLSGNVEVFSLGKEKGKNRLREFVNFQKGIWRFLPEIDGIFCHMGQIYTILAAPYAKVFRKKLISWYSHKAITWQTRLMHFLSDKVVTPTPKGFGIDSSKKIVLGHGIDTERFLPSEAPKKRDIFTIVSVARFSPIKDYETLIEAVDILEKQGGRIRVDLIYRQPEKKNEKIYFEKIREMVRERELTGVFNFLGTVANEKLAEHYQESDISINLCPTGSPDKVVYESMACGVPALACNRTFIDDFGPYREQLLFEQKNSRDLAEKIADLMRMEKEELKKMGMFLKQRVVRHHNLDRLIEKIIELF